MDLTHLRPVTIELVYVNDLILSWNYHSQCTNVKLYQIEWFHIKGFGKNKTFSWFEMIHLPFGVSLCQIRYTINILKRIMYDKLQAISFYMFLSLNSIPMQLC